MNIAHVTPTMSLEAGGLATAVAELSAATLRLGHDVVVVTDTSAGTIDFPQEIVRPFSARWLTFGAAVDAAERVFTSAGCDVVHVHGLWAPAGSAAIRAARRIGLPYVVAAHGMLDPWALSVSRAKKKVALASFEGWNLRGAAALHALNAAEADAIRALGYGARIVIVPNGVRSAPLRHLNGGASEAQRSLLFLGRLHPKKGLHNLLTAWRTALDRFPGVLDAWRIEVAGAGAPAYVSTVEKLTKRLRLVDVVRFLGPVQNHEKEEAFARASAFVLPSYSEGLPMAVLEAMARGIPALITDCCNMPDVTARGAALRIAVEPEEMALQLATHLNDADTLARVGAAARAMAIAEFDWNVVAARWIRLYQGHLDTVSAQCARWGTSA